MSLSDCEYCWNTPCTCGWEYKDWTLHALKHKVRQLEKIIKFKEQNKGTKITSHEQFRQIMK